MAAMNVFAYRNRMSAKRRRGEGGPPGRTAANRHAILLEAIQEQNRATMEAVFASEQKFEQKLEDLRRDLTLRIEALNGAVRLNSEGIRQNSEGIRQNTEDIRQNSEHIRKNTEDIRKNTQGIQRNSEEIQRLGEATRANTEQIRLNTEELKRHSEELRRLSAALEGKSDQASLVGLEKRVSALEKRVGL